MYSFIDDDGVIWKSLDAEGLPNVLVGSNKTFRYVDGKVLNINKKGFVRPSYKNKVKNLKNIKILHKYFGNKNGWVKLDYVGYSNYACNTEKGLIRNDENGRILGSLKPNGYIEVHLFNENGGRFFGVHRIVAYLAYGIDLYDEKININHKNENKSDNRACNLIPHTTKQNTTWSKVNKTGYTNIHKYKNNKYYYKISKYCFKTEKEAYEWRCWAMSIAGIEDLKEGFREPINRDKVWMSLAIVNCPDYVINQKGKILNITKCNIDKHTEKDYLNGTFKTCKNGKIYHVIQLHNIFKKPKTFSTHVLLAKCFIYNPVPEKYNRVDHDDNNSLNNSLDNLQWTITRHNNTKDAKRTGNYPNVYKQINKNNFLVTFKSNRFDTPEEAQEDMKRVFKLLDLEYVDRSELRANEKF